MGQNYCVQSQAVQARTAFGSIHLSKKYRVRLCALLLQAFSVSSWFITAGPATAADYVIAVAPPTDTDAIDHALTIAREHRRTKPTDAIILDFAPGTYRVTTPIVLGPSDAGASGSELVLRGDRAHRTVISGSIILEPGKAVSSTSGNAGEVISFRPNSEASQFFPKEAYAFFRSGKRILPAREPIQGYSEVALGIVKNSKTRVAITLPQILFRQLSQEQNLWVGGYLAYDWLYETLPVVAVDDATSSLIVERASSLAPRLRGRIAIYNAASALGSKGSSSLTIDSAKGQITVWPQQSDQPVEMITSQGVLSLVNTGFVRLEGIAVERSLGPAVLIQQSHDVALDTCFVGQTVGDALSIMGGKDVEVRRCVVADTTNTAVVISGGDRPSLTRAGHRLIDSIVANFGVVEVAPGISLGGVGNTVRGCFVSAGPHWGLQLSGNDHTIEGNEFSDVVRETDDAGVLYMGRDWTQRGNRIVGNFLHDFGQRVGGKYNGTFGIYLDDQFSGAEIDNNVIVGGKYSILVGGGRDNHVSSNLFVAPDEAGIFVDDRGQAWQKAYGNENSTLMKNLHAVDIQSPLWHNRYPALANLPYDKPGFPVGNVFENNATINAPTVHPWRKSAGDLIKDVGSRTLTAPEMSDWPPNAVAAIASRTVLGTIAFRKEALSTLPFADRAEIAAQ